MRKNSYVQEARQSPRISLRCPSHSRWAIKTWGPKDRSSVLCPSEKCNFCPKDSPENKTPLFCCKSDGSSCRWNCFLMHLYAVKCKKSFQWIHWQSRDIQISGFLSSPVLSSSAVFIHGLGEEVRNPHGCPGEQAVAGLLAQLCSLKLVRWPSD